MINFIIIRALNFFHFMPRADLVSIHKPDIHKILIYVFINVHFAL